MPSCARTFLFWLALAGLQLACSKTVVYVSLQGDQAIDLYDFDAGSLVKVQSYPTGGRVAAMAIHPSKKFLYASLSQDEKLQSYAIDPVTGRLSFQNEIDDVESSASLSVAKGRDNDNSYYLLASYHRAGQVVVWDLDDNAHTLVDGSAQVISTAKCAHMVTVIENKYAFVPHTCGNVIDQFQWQANGQLVQNGDVDPGRRGFWIFSQKRGPRHYVVHPSLQWVYFSNELDSSISQYGLDRTKGTLQLWQSWSTLPRMYRLVRQNTVAQIHMTPDGRFVYVSNRGHDSIAGFEINPINGSLTSLGQFPTEPRPRAFDISPDGSHMLVAGQDSGKLALYSIQENGMLEHLKTIDCGSNPMWVEFVVLP